MKIKKFSLVHLTVLALAGSLFCRVAGCVTAHAQETNASGGITTVTNPIPDNPLTAPVVPSLAGGLTEILSSVGLVTDPTNYAAAIFYGRSLKGNQSSAGLVVIENVNNYVGLAAGVDTLWGGGKIGSANIVAGGISLKMETHPLKFLASSTNSWFAKFTTTQYGIALVGTPINGTSNNGGLAAINRAGVAANLFAIKRVVIAPAVDYGNRTGAGNYSGNWVDFMLTGRVGF